MALRPIGLGQSMSITGASGQSDGYQVQSSTVRLYAKDTDMCVRIDGNPTAKHTDFIIKADTVETLGQTRGSQAVESIDGGATTTVWAPEGVSWPFVAGDYVGLTTANDSNWWEKIDHVAVASIVDSPAGPGGYFKSKMVLTVDTSGISTAFSVNNNGSQIVRSNKVAGIGTNGGIGSLWIQQVQISGDA